MFPFAAVGGNRPDFIPDARLGFLGEIVLRLFQLGRLVIRVGLHQPVACRILYSIPLQHPRAVLFQHQLHVLGLSQGNRHVFCNRLRSGFFYHHRLHEGVIFQRHRLLCGSLLCRGFLHRVFRFSIFRGSAAGRSGFHRQVQVAGNGIVGGIRDLDCQQISGFAVHGDPIAGELAGGSVNVQIKLASIRRIFEEVRCLAAAHGQHALGEGLAGGHFEAAAVQGQGFGGNGAVLDLEAVDRASGPAVLVLRVHLNGVGAHCGGRTAENAGAGIELQAIGNGAVELPTGQRAIGSFELHIHRSVLLKGAVFLGLNCGNLGGLCRNVQHKAVVAAARRIGRGRFHGIGAGSVGLAADGVAANGQAGVAGRDGHIPVHRRAGLDCQRHGRIHVLHQVLVAGDGDGAGLHDDLLSLGTGGLTAISGIAGLRLHHHGDGLILIVRRDGVSGTDRAGDLRLIAKPLISQGRRFGFLGLDFGLQGRSVGIDHRLRSALDGHAGQVGNVGHLAGVHGLLAAGVAAGAFHHQTDGLADAAGTNVHRLRVGDDRGVARIVHRVPSQLHAGGSGLIDRLQTVTHVGSRILGGQVGDAGAGHSTGGNDLLRFDRRQRAAVVRARAGNGQLDGLAHRAHGHFIVVVGADVYAVQLPQAGVGSAAGLHDRLQTIAYHRRVMIELHAHQLLTVGDSGGVSADRVAGPTAGAVYPQAEGAAHILLGHSVGGVVAHHGFLAGGVGAQPLIGDGGVGRIHALDRQNVAHHGVHVVDGNAVDLVGGVLDQELAHHVAHAAADLNAVPAVQAFQNFHLRTDAVNADNGIIGAGAGAQTHTLAVGGPHGRVAVIAGSGAAVLAQELGHHVTHVAAHADTAPVLAFRQNDGPGAYRPLAQHRVSGAGAGTHPHAVAVAADHGGVGVGHGGHTAAGGLQILAVHIAGAPVGRFHPVPSVADTENLHGRAGFVTADGGGAKGGLRPQTKPPADHGRVFRCRQCAGHGHQPDQQNCDKQNRKTTFHLKIPPFPLRIIRKAFHNY